MPKQRRVFSVKKTIKDEKVQQKDEKIQMDTEDKIKEPKGKPKTIEVKEFELFEDTSVNTKVIEAKKKQTTKPTKREKMIENEAKRILEKGIKDNTNNNNKKEKVKDIWKMSANENVDLTHLKEPQINPINPLWHPKMKVVSHLTKRTQYKKNGVIGPMKCRKMAIKNSQEKRKKGKQ